MLNTIQSNLDVVFMGLMTLGVMAYVIKLMITDMKEGKF